ncbi:Non-canonical purine NTP pyrophosphatase [Fundidesulfovibrio magnetotacticus]|uniref:dITP/XTP pyrophosphatase n=1 Tax=Fundidesulfovibrio magnetotacticus TaxID=2730080 RepID=A0A6V8LLQ2_9BACT|nr:XTP/dITP diphosphatase [Fundidesulfovibrio magnetotacticus]GFK93613.1 Non-canonical purine NTP pyrophosphatase [Fundidesulfovibrio magnetotacticus]
MSQVVLATRNQGKVKELQALMEGTGIAVLGLDQFPQVGEIEETGSTFEENARIKAKTVSEATGLIALADDSGLEVEALDAAPGVRSARYAGEKATDAENNAKLLEAMADVPNDKRACRFISCVAVHAPDGHELVFHGVWRGNLAREPRGENGFGYDPLFVDLELKQTAAEMAPEQKNWRSHRGRAVRELVKYLPGFVEKVALESALTPEERDLKDRLAGVKGWLRVLCWVMMIVVPLVCAAIVSRNLRYMEALKQANEVSRELAAEVAKGLTAENVLALVVGAVMFWAGLSLYRRKRGSVMFAKIAWFLAPLASGLQYCFIYFLNFPDEVHAMATGQVLANALPALAAASTAIFYLNLSQRVRATYFLDR